MIRVRDFAQACNCSPQNIYKHLRNYAAELDGHVQDTRRGKVLDEYACDFLRDVMYPKELVPSDEETKRELEQLRSALWEAGVKSSKLAAALAKVEGERDKALFEASHYQKALNASQEEQEARKVELNQARQEAQKAAQEALEAQQRAKATQEALEAAEARLEALKARSWWERLTRKGEEA